MTTIYLGTYTKKTSKGIYATTLEDGKLTPPTLMASLPNPTYLATTPDHKFVYSVVKRGDHGGIAALARTADGHLTLINEVLAAGAAPCYVSFDAKRKLVYSANYHTGCVKVYQQNADGSLQLSDTFTNHGHGPKPEQDAAHMHYIDVLPDGTLVACDLGCDQVLTFTVDAAGKLHHEATLTTPAGFAPRHLVMVDATTGYLVGELSSQVAWLSYSAATHAFTFKESYATIPADFTAHNGAAAIKLSPDKQTIYVSNRGHNSLAVFARQADNSLKLVQLCPSHGDFPRDFAVIGDYLVCAHQEDDQLTLFSRNHDGTLQFKAATVCPEGVCVLPFA